MREINEIMFKPQESIKKDVDDKEPPNSGILILNATCTPADVTYPQEDNRTNSVEKQNN